MPTAGCLRDGRTYEATAIVASRQRCVQSNRDETTRQANTCHPGHSDDTRCLRPLKLRMPTSRRRRPRREETEMPQILVTADRSDDMEEGAVMLCERVN